MKQRVKKIFQVIQKPLDAIIIKNAGDPFIDVNFFYVTGLEKGIFEGCVAVLYPDRTIDLIVSELEAESAKKAIANLYIYKNTKDRDSLVEKLLQQLRTIGLNFSGILHQDYLRLHELSSSSTFIDVSKELINVRLVKDVEELQSIQKACTITDEAMKKVPDILHEGIYEYEAAAEINHLMEKKGADKPAFETITSFGKNAAEPHYSHGLKKLRKGDLVVCDFGASYRKYNSDITRTFICGKPMQKQIDMYETVRSAQNIGFDLVRPGVKASDVHHAVDAYINTTKFKGRFIHSTGHSLGLAVHDGPGFTPENDIMLRENMVFTVEPGVYIPSFGGLRIEDDVRVTKKGIELLTHSPRELIQI